MQENTTRLRRGDFIRARLAGATDEWANAFVALASDANPSSVVLIFSNGGGVRTSGGGFIFHVLPLTVDYDKETAQGLVTQDLYEIEVRDAATDR